MAVELPARNVYFVNRDEERAWVRRAVEEWREEDRPLVVNVSGPGGCGKTELVRVMARELSGRYTDVLFVDLDEFRLGGTLDANDVLGQLLDALGVGADSLRRSFQARCRQFWSLTAGRRLALVVDNARYASEVLPLLPASGRSVVLVVSHGRLEELGQDGAVLDMVLPPLSEAASVEMLERITADGRLAADPAAARALAALCSGLPAALRSAAAVVRKHHLRPLPRLLAELRAELTGKGVPVVERAWDAACKDLTPDAALLYRLLAEHPGPAFTRASATALLGLGADACDDALEELDHAGLLDVRSALRGGQERMRMPELQRGHARRHPRPGAEGDELARAHGRLLRWYTRQFQRADRYAAGERLLVCEQVAPVPGAPDVPLADPGAAPDGPSRRAIRQAAGRWLYDERHALLGCVRLAHARGLDDEAVALCEPLWTYALDHPGQPAVTEAFRLGLESALRSGHADRIVRMRCQLARPLWESQEPAGPAEAADQLDRAQAALPLLGDSSQETKVRASAIEFRGMLDSATGDWPRAAAAFDDSRELHASIGNAYGVMLQTYRLGQAREKLGDPRGAAALLEQAHQDAIGLERERMAARTGFALAHVLLGLGDQERARGLYEESLTAARARGSDFDQARVLDALAELATRQRREEEAARHRAAADAIRRRNGLA